MPLSLVAPTAIAYVPDAVGTPCITPVAVSNDSHPGRPVALKLVGSLFALTWKLNGSPTTTFAVEALTIDGGGSCTVSPTKTALWPLSLLALTTNFENPTLGGVPLKVPPLNVSQSGPDSFPKEVGFPVAVIG